MIYDCFPFFNELDLAEIRIKELYDHVDYFVISESNLTHSGQSKPLYFQENKERFARFSDKIINVVCPNPPLQADMNWVREKNQRNFIFQVLKDRCKDDDIIITSDTDEIVSANKISEIKNIKEMVFLQMKPSYYYLNLVSDPSWTVAKALPYWVLRQHFRGDLSQVRVSGAPTLQNIGWHFSYMGGRDQVIKKIESFAHQEFNTFKYKNEKQLDLVIRFGSSIWDEFKEIEPRGEIPYWKYVDPNNYDLPTCVKNGEYNHMLSNVRFNYNYDCGNLYHLFNLAKEYTGEGEVLDIGCGDGRSSVFLANALPENTIYCMGSTGNFKNNMDSLTNGNYQEVSEDFLHTKKIKVLHLNCDWELTQQALNSQLADKFLLCGYNHVDKFNLAGFQVSGNFWYRHSTGV